MGVFCEKKEENKFAICKSKEEAKSSTTLPNKRLSFSHNLERSLENP